MPKFTAYNALGQDIQRNEIDSTAWSCILPIGTILPWAKTLTGTPALPANFVECNGQVLNDAGSIYNGLTMPALNAANRFLRGNTTSGGTGGGGTHNHQISGSYRSVQSGGSYTNVWDGTNSTSATNEPAYMDVVWIIKIKHGNY